MRHHRLYPASAVTVLCLLAAFALGTSASGTGSTEPYATYEAAVTTDAPAAQYRFDEGAGATTLADSAGTRTATSTSITLGGAGPFGGSKSGAFNGTSSIAALPSTALSTASAFTAEAWVKWAGGSTNQHVFDLGSSTTSYMYLTPSSSASNSPLRFEIKSGATVFDLDATKLGLNAWHYLAVTEDAGGTLRLYLDGAQVATKTSVTISPRTLGQTSANWLGRSQSATDPKFSGSLSNVAFYTQALSAARITAHWNAANFPVSTVAPTVSGTTTDGQKLTGAAGTWSGLSPMTYTYQWRRCDSSGQNCTAIAGATASTYTLTGADVGSKLVLAVTGTNSAGASTASSAASAVVAGFAPSNSQLPAITGTASDGQTLSASKGTWAGSVPIAYAYQWRRCDSAGANCTDIAAATASTYVIASADVAHKLRVVVTGSNSSGSAAATSLATTNAVAAVAPANTAVPVISGSANDGQTLTSSNGTWTGTTPITYGYQWQHCNSTGASCTNLSAATAASYALTAADLGFTIRAVVTATNSVSHVSATSVQTAVVAAAPPQNTALPSISGTTSDGQTLTAANGSWSGSAPITYAYRWRRCDGAGANCADIAGATAATYALGAADDGNELRVVVTATNQRGVVPATSAASNVVTPVNSGACTDVWNGRAGDGLWGSAGNWSAGRVPNGSDRACASSGTSIRISSGAAAGSFYSQGSLDLASGNFTLTDAQTPSSVLDLTLADTGGAATLMGDGTITVTRTLLWNTNGALWGHLVLAASGTGTVATTDPALAGIDSGGSFTNNGDFTVASGRLQGANGAQITNNGTFHVNAEGGCCSVHGLSYDGRGAVPTLINHGMVVKDVGTGETHINFDYQNQGGYLYERTGTIVLGGAYNEAPISANAGLPTIDVTSDASTTLLWDGASDLELPVDAESGIGIRSVVLLDPAGQTESTSNADCPTLCPKSWSTTFTIPASAIPNEGGRFRVVATNSFGDATTADITVERAPASADDHGVEDGDDASDPGETGWADDVPPDYCTPDPDVPDDDCTDTDANNAAVQAALLQAPLSGDAVPVTGDTEPPMTAEVGPLGFGSSESSTSDGNSVGWGLGDQHLDMFSDSRFSKLDVQYVRLIVPWDVVPRGMGESETGRPADPNSLQEVDNWISAAYSSGYKILISFQHSRGDDCTSSSDGFTPDCRIPTVTQYSNAFGAFKARYGLLVSDYTAWNEPDHPVQPTFNHPYRAGQFWHTAWNACRAVPKCTVAAGDFSDVPAYFTAAYFSDYVHGTSRHPSVWAFHPYYAAHHVREGHADLRWLERFTSATQAKSPGSSIWLTEAGPIRAAPGKPERTPQEAVDAMSRLLTEIPAAPGLEERLKRLYVYQWKGDSGWDSGLVAASNNCARQVYYEFRLVTAGNGGTTRCPTS